MTDKVRVQFRVRPEVKEDMKMLYQALYRKARKDDHRRYTKDFSMNTLWEMAVSHYLNEEGTRIMLNHLRKNGGKLL